MLTESTYHELFPSGFWSILLRQLGLVGLSLWSGLSPQHGSEQHISAVCNWIPTKLSLAVAANYPLSDSSLGLFV